MSHSLWSESSTYVVFGKTTFTMSFFPQETESSWTFIGAFVTKTVMRGPIVRQLREPRSRETNMEKTIEIDVYILLCWYFTQHHVRNSHTTRKCAILKMVRKELTLHLIRLFLECAQFPVSFIAIKFHHNSREHLGYSMDYVCYDYCEPLACHMTYNETCKIFKTFLHKSTSEG